MAEEIQPALTAEEWRCGFAERPNRTVELGVLVTDHTDYTISVQDERTLHALAALCLYGQPFGFTREDLKALMWAIDDSGDLLAAKLRSLADRIAALLPPEEK